MNEVLLIGSSGMLGSDVKFQLESRKIQTYSPSSQELDVRSKKSIEEYCGSFNLKWIINCSAWTKVDDAEVFPQKAKALNEAGVRNLAYLAQEKSCPLIHISTDYVFDGNSHFPYSESDVPRPINSYGLSKFLGEKALKDLLLDDSYILRTSWLYGRTGKNFVKTIVRKGINHEKVNVVNDQYGSPTYSWDLAEGIVSIINKKPEPGTYHFSNLGECTWFEFAKEIYRLIGSDDNLIAPVPSNYFPLRARRPIYSVLSKTKWADSGISELKDWETSLRNFVCELVKSESGEE